MYACIDPLAKYPQQTAIGKDEFGKFRTAVCKEYPPHFSAGMARAIIDQLCTEVRNGSLSATPEEKKKRSSKWFPTQL